MQSKEKIEQELNKHIEHRKKIYNDSNKKNDKRTMVRRKKKRDRWI